MEMDVYEAWITTLMTTSPACWLAGGFEHQSRDTDHVHRSEGHRRGTAEVLKIRVGQNQVELAVLCPAVY